MMTARRVHTYTPVMPRWPTDARERLEQAALELFFEQGFAETSVPQIAARAGLTTRTFFRHFADKREVLFGGEDPPARIEQLMAEVPTSVGPVALVVSQLGPFAEAVFGGRRAALRMRQRIIETDQGLRERELQKMARMKSAIVHGFQRRGSDDLTASLAADLAMAVLGAALARWLADERARPLSAFVEEATGSLKQLTADLHR